MRNREYWNGVLAALIVTILVIGVMVGCGFMAEVFGVVQ